MKSSSASWLLLLVLSLGFTAQAQPTQQWQRFFNEKPNTDTELYGFRQLRPGYLVALTSEQVRRPTPSGVLTDYWAGLWFFNQQGDTVRTRVRRQNDYEGYNSVTQLRTGRLFLTGGRYNGVGVAPNFTYSQTDSLGNLLWTRVLPVPAVGGPNPVLALPDGGALWAHNVNISTSSTSTQQIPQVEVLRLDSLGAIVWQQRYGTPYTQIEALTLQADGSYVLVGEQQRPVTPGPGYLVSDIWLQRIQLDGTLVGPAQTLGALVDGEYVSDAQPTPNGGLLLAATIYPNYYSSQRGQGWLVQLDSQGSIQWQQRILGAGTAAGAQSQLHHAQPLTNGQVLVSATRTQANQPVRYNNGYLAAYQPNGSGGATVSWEQYLLTSSALFSTLSPTGTLTLAGKDFVDNTQLYRGVLTRFANAGVPYVPDWCQTPPRAQPFAQQPTPDSLRLLDASVAGPAYAQLVGWHWELGDGTSYDGPRPPRKQYSPIPPPGTPVRLTVTNNLGCTSTYTLYPWGAPSASQLSRELSQRLSLYPNPTTSTATLTLSGLTSAEPVTVELHNALGQLVLPTQQLRPRGEQLRQELDLSMLPSGVYSLLVRTRQGQAVKRLVKQ